MPPSRDTINILWGGAVARAQCFCWGPWLQPLSPLWVLYHSCSWLHALPSSSAQVMYRWCRVTKLPAAMAEAIPDRCIHKPVSWRKEHVGCADACVCGWWVGSSAGGEGHRLIDGWEGRCEWGHMVVGRGGPLGTVSQYLLVKQEFPIERGTFFIIFWNVTMRIL